MPQLGCAPGGEQARQAAKEAQLLQEQQQAEAVAQRALREVEGQWQRELQELQRLQQAEADREQEGGAGGEPPPSAELSRRASTKRSNLVGR